MIRIIIADDQDLVRDSMSLLLSRREGIEVVGTAADGFKAVDMIRTLDPDVALIDARMPHMDGLEACQRIKESGSKCRVIILTTFNDEEYITKAVKYGVDGYILKGVEIEQIEQAIRTAIRGGTTISPSVASKMIHLFQNDISKSWESEMNEEIKKCISELTESEQKIMKCIGHGMSNKEISAKLFLSSGTVRNVVSNIFSKFNVDNRTQLALIAAQYWGDSTIKKNED